VVDAIRAAAAGESVARPGDDGIGEALSFGVIAGVDVPVLDLESVALAPGVCDLAGCFFGAAAAAGKC
jgi:hypothetical protein